MLALGAFIALLAYLATDEDWSSAHIFLIGVIAAALLGSLLVVLPSIALCAVLSLVILFHFTGIFVAATNVAAPGGSVPWLVDQSWAYVYRYYLGYLYMTNAYHFYSPDPGPSTLVRFRVQYADDTYQWVQVPFQKDSPVVLNYTRSMVLADSTNLNMPISAELLQLRYNDRRASGNFFAPKSIPISPLDLDDPKGNHLDASRYQEPNEFSKKLIASYVPLRGAAPSP